jgi:hypothetical protein
MAQKEIENAAATVCHTQAVLSQYVRYLVFHSEASVSGVSGDCSRKGC